ncbi:MAG: hypothetical protein HFF04_00945 [Oscillospiraceae bacterium]|nr:hypothetical protein [Oscillospiraceae bacterium]
MENKENNLWVEVGNACLKKALALLNEETAPTAATAETVALLVKTALQLDEADYRWQIASQSAVPPIMHERATTVNCKFTGSLTGLGKIIKSKIDPEANDDKE